MKISGLDKARALSERQIIKKLRRKLEIEFERQGKETNKWLRREGILEELDEFFRKELPENYEKNRLKGNFEKVSKKHLAKIKALIVDWGDEVDPETKMKRILVASAILSGNNGGRFAIKDLKLNIGFNLRNPEMLDALAKRGALITGKISKRTLKDFQNIMVDSYVEQGMSPYLIRQRITKLFKETYKNRAFTIARTETATAQSFVKHQTYKRNGVQIKRWDFFKTKLSRTWHEAVQGQRRKINEKFDVGGERLDHDHDPSAKAHNVVNCNCNTKYITDFSVPFKKWNGA